MHQPQRFSFHTHADDCFLFDSGRLGRDKSYRKSVMASCLANKDKAEAQYQLGIIYYHGLGVRKNLSEAKKWLRKASLRGDASAQGALGVLYGNGEGDWKNCGEAEKWLLKSAEQVNDSAQLNLGIFYTSESCGKTDAVKAVK